MNEKLRQMIERAQEILSNSYSVISLVTLLIAFAFTLFMNRAVLSDHIDYSLLGSISEVSATIFALVFTITALTVEVGRTNLFYDVGDFFTKYVYLYMIAFVFAIILPFYGHGNYVVTNISIWLSVTCIFLLVPYLHCFTQKLKPDVFFEHLRMTASRRWRSPENVRKIVSDSTLRERWIPEAGRLFDAILSAYNRNDERLRHMATDELLNLGVSIEERGNEVARDRLGKTLIEIRNDAKISAKAGWPVSYALAVWDVFWYARNVGVRVMESPLTVSIFLGELRRTAIRAIENHLEISLKSILDDLKVIVKEAWKKYDEQRVSQMYRAVEIVGHALWILGAYFYREVGLRDEMRSILFDQPYSFDGNHQVWVIEGNFHWEGLLGDMIVLLQDIEGKLNTKKGGAQEVYTQAKSQLENVGDFPSDLVDWLHNFAKLCHQKEYQSILSKKRPWKT